MQIFLRQKKTESVANIPHKLFNVLKRRKETPRE